MRYTAFLLLVLTLTLSACHPPPTIVTPHGQTAYRADQIVVRVNELMNAAIAAESAGSLPTATARTIVQFSVSADRILAATPAGWQATLTVSWIETKKKFGPQTNPTILAAISAVDVVLATVGGQP